MSLEIVIYDDAELAVLDAYRQTYVNKLSKKKSLIRYTDSMSLNPKNYINDKLFNFANVDYELHYGYVHFTTVNSDYSDYNVIYHIADKSDKIYTALSHKANVRFCTTFGNNVVIYLHSSLFSKVAPPEFNYDNCQLIKVPNSSRIIHNWSTMYDDCICRFIR